MTDREFERLLEVLQDMNRSIEQGMEHINRSLEKISEEMKELR